MMLGEVIRVEPELIIECRELKTLSILGTQVHPGMIEVIEDAELLLSLSIGYADLSLSRLLLRGIG
jgi:hypothetical protein